MKLRYFSLTIKHPMGEFGALLKRQGLEPKL